MPVIAAHLCVFSFSPGIEIMCIYKYGSVVSLALPVIAVLYIIQSDLFRIFYQYVIMSLFEQKDWANHPS